VSLESTYLQWAGASEILGAVYDTSLSSVPKALTIYIFKNEKFSGDGLLEAYHV
jgi:hypothetical protein